MKRPAHHAFAALIFLAAIVGLGSSGCDSSSGTRVGGGITRILGQALAPEGDGDQKTQVPLDNGTVVLLEIDDNGDVVSAVVGMTDADGNFQVDVNAQAVVAVVVQGMTDEGMAEISGLYNPNQPTVEKDLDEVTSIACIAGLSAIGDGSITDEQLDETRVQNLEDAAADYLDANPNFDFYDSGDLDAAVSAVRSATNDGANPAT